MAQDPQSTKEALLIAKYLSERRVVVVDSSSVMRSAFNHIFQELGLPTNLLSLATSFGQARDEIISRKPHVVVTEYSLGKYCGLDLLPIQLDQLSSQSRDHVFIVLMTEPSQATIAHVMEEEIDACLLKPFKPVAATKALREAILDKIRPSKYLIELAAGKAAMLSGKLDAAEAHFEAAAKLDKYAEKANHYLRQLMFLRRILIRSQAQPGLNVEFTNIDYKCMVGLYELLLTQQKHGAAYDVVKRISRHFPSNPKRLREVVRLAIEAGGFDDIERYYTIFVNLDERDAELTQLMCESMRVCALHFLKKKQGRARAISLFKKIAATTGRDVRILSDIIQTLLDHGLAGDAEEFLRRFPAESSNSNDFLLMRFLILNAQGRTPKIIDEGRLLLSRGVRDERLYLVMIKRSMEARLWSAASILYHDALNLFSKNRKVFEQLVRSLPGCDKVLSERD